MCMGVSYIYIRKINEGDTNFTGSNTPVKNIVRAKRYRISYIK
jgi:hypothetical protein